MGTRRVAGFSGAVLRISRTESRPDIAIPLAYSTGLMGIETETRQVNSGNRNAANVLSLSSDQLTLSNILFKFFFYFAANDLLESTMVLFNFRDQIIFAPPFSHHRAQTYCLPNST